jgi:formamidopyrimidine-DNA glycosylase
MPELPEVESLRALLARSVVGRVITKVEVREPRLRRPVRPQLAAALRDRTIRAIRRRAKYLLLDLGADVLLIHLGMSGSLTHRREPQGGDGVEPRSAGRLDSAVRLDPRHDHVKLMLDDSSALVYNDPRRFGLIKLLPRADLGAAEELKALGPDALSDAFNAAYLAAKARHRRTAIKNLLMDQRVVAGLGNIYAAEALFRAGVRPGRRAAALTPAEINRIVDATGALLREAIGAGGTSFRNYLDARGRPGRFAPRLMVYARAGERCYVCSTLIRSRVLGQRSSCYCPRCQR